MLAPVARGVEKLEGSSEVKIVAEEGEMRYFAVRVARRASLKPVLVFVRQYVPSCTSPIARTEYKG